MMDMVERVARAICRANGRDPDRLEPGDAPGIDGQLPNGDPAHFVWKHHIDEARAAIEAMREPTDAMLDAGANAIDAIVPAEAPDFFIDAQPVLEAIIDAAFTPSPASK